MPSLVSAPRFELTYAPGSGLGSGRQHLNARPPLEELVKDFAAVIAPGQARRFRKPPRRAAAVHRAHLLPCRVRHRELACDRDTFAFGKPDDRSSLSFQAQT